MTDNGVLRIVVIPATPGRRGRPLRWPRSATSDRRLVTEAVRDGRSALFLIA